MNQKQLIKFLQDQDEKGYNKEDIFAIANSFASHNEIEKAWDSAFEEAEALPEDMMRMYQILGHPESYVNWWLNSKKKHITKDGVIQDNSKEGKSIRGDPMAAVSQMKLDYNSEMRAFNGSVSKDFQVKGFSADLMKDALIFLSHKDIMTRFDNLAEKISYDKNTKGEKELEKFLIAMTGECRLLDKIVMRHFIWQVKRKMKDEKVIYHMMIVYFGAQGGGKSYNLKQFFGPVLAEVFEADFDSITDSRNQLALIQSCIGFFDEMGKADRSDIESIKKVITASSLNVRLFHTQKAPPITQHSTFIGTSNKRLNELITDTTGMRRFWEMECLSAEELVKNHEMLNSLDYLSIWRSIDEGLDTPELKQHLDQIESEQDGLVAIDPFEMFLEEQDIDGLLPLASRTLYNFYSKWCKDSGFMAVAIGKFTTLLKNKRYIAKPCTKDGLRVTIISMPIRAVK